MIQSKRGRRPDFWTKEREQKLRDMNARGATDGEIALKFGCSRNTIIGKRSRMGISAVNARIEMTIAQRRARRNELERERRRLLRIIKPKVVKAVPVEPEAIGPLNDVVDWSSCRWIVGDPRDADWRMCGAVKSEGSSYCEHHHARAMAPRLARLAA